jgi:hypothetical protein
MKSLNQTRQKPRGKTRPGTETTVRSAKWVGSLRPGGRGGEQGAAWAQIPAPPQERLHSLCAFPRLENADASSAAAEAGRVTSEPFQPNQRPKCKWEPGPCPEPNPDSVSSSTNT